MEDQSVPSAAKRDAGFKNQAMHEMKLKMKAAKATKNRFVFEKFLEAASVKRGTPGWKAAWEYFYSDEH